MATLPKDSFARKIITMQGYTDEQAIGEVMHADKVSHDEAVRRLAKAKAQHINRSAGQYVRFCRARDAVNEARQRVLSIARRPGGFICANDLGGIAAITQWTTPDGDWDTGRTFRDILRILTHGTRGKSKTNVQIDPPKAWALSGGGETQPRVCAIEWWRSDIPYD